MSATWTELLQTHGYWLLALGCLMEGETLLLMAGFAAHRGHLDLGTVIAIAALAGFAGDELWFWVGRRFGARLLHAWPVLGRNAQRLHAMSERWHAAAIVGLRFAYGLRIAGPLWMGASPVGATYFAAYNALGALVWAPLVAGLGWAFGAAAERLVGEIRHLEGWLLVLLATLGAAAWAWHAWRRRRA